MTITNKLKQFNLSKTVMAVFLCFFMDSLFAQTENVRDEFNFVSYSNNDGSVNWAAPWTELSDDGSVSSGNVLITSNRLQFAFSGKGAYRGAADLSSATSATITLQAISRENGNDTWVLKHLMITAIAGHQFIPMFLLVVQV